MAIIKLDKLGFIKIKLIFISISNIDIDNNNNNSNNKIIISKAPQLVGNHDLN